jgi:hypothetical protein
MCATGMAVCVCGKCTSWLARTERWKVFFCNEPQHGIFIGFYDMIKRVSTPSPNLHLCARHRRCWPKLKRHLVVKQSKKYASKNIEAWNWELCIAGQSACLVTGNVKYFLVKNYFWNAIEGNIWVKSWSKLNHYGFNVLFIGDKKVNLFLVYLFRTKTKRINT